MFPRTPPAAQQCEALRFLNRCFRELHPQRNNAKRCGLEFWVSSHSSCFFFGFPLIHPAFGRNNAKRCGFLTIENTHKQKPGIPLHKYVQYRMKSTNPALYSHFADRLWLSQWDKIRRCNASVPKVLAFFSQANISELQFFVAPATGAVVKLTHMASNVKILKPHNTLQLDELKRYIRLLRENYSNEKEIHYRHIPHGVIIEEFLDSFRGQSPPDYKSYAFDGTVAMVRILMNRSCMHTHCKMSSLIVDPVTFKKMPFHDQYPSVVHELPKPCGWEDTMQAVQCLSSGINFARFDMYIFNCMPFVGEMTMTPMGGNEEVFGGGSEFLGKFLSGWDIYPRGFDEGILR